MTADITNSSLIACICEGGAETTIIDILLDNDLLIFSREQLIEESAIPRCSVKEFERRYLRREYEQKLLVLRIIDSRTEEFNLSRAYRHQVDVVNVITAPEIEILIITKLGKYADYKKSGYKKPSEYCKSVLKYKNVKSPNFVKDFFANPQDLVFCINEYHRVHKQLNNEISLYDLLRSKDVISSN